MSADLHFTHSHSHNTPLHCITLVALQSTRYLGYVEVSVRIRIRINIRILHVWHPQARFRIAPASIFCRRKWLQIWPLCTALWIKDTAVILGYKKLIRRWDSKRELSLRRYRTRTAKFNRLVHKFHHRSMRLCVRMQVYQIQWNNAMQRLLCRSRSLKVTDYGTNRKLIYDFVLVINTNLPPLLHRLQVIADYWSDFR